MTHRATIQKQCGISKALLVILSCRHLVDELHIVLLDPAFDYDVVGGNP